MCLIVIVRAVTLDRITPWFGDPSIATSEPATEGIKPVSQNGWRMRAKSATAQKKWTREITTSHRHTTTRKAPNSDAS